MKIDLTIPEYAYMLGFFQTDGHLEQGPSNKGRLRVEINSQDSWLLYQLKRLIPCHVHIGERTRDTNFSDNYTSSYMMVYDSEFRRVINELGVPYGKKSAVISPPTGDVATVDYYRGVVDGDGSLGITGKGFPYLSLVTASEQLACGFSAYVTRVTGKQKNLHRNTRDNVYNITVYKEDAQFVASELYYPSCLSLPRKYSKAQELRKWIRPASMRRVSSKRLWSSTEDDYILTHTMDESIEHLGRTESSIRMRTWRLCSSNN